jgi:hypothetical protein
MLQTGLDVEECFHFEHSFTQFDFQVEKKQLRKAVTADPHTP